MSYDHPIILASSSRYRRLQLQQLQLDFRCESPSICEHAKPNETARSLACRLALEKANTIKAHHSNAVIIAADQTADLNGTILNKPESHERAREQLLVSSGKSVIFYSALCVMHKEKALQTCVTTEVAFRNLNSAEIERYLNKEQPYDCAGSFKCEGLGIALFQSIKSEDPSALIGLPLIKLNLFLIDFGINAI